MSGGLMADTFTPSQRSDVMRAVRSHNTGPELLVRRLIWAMGYRYHLHASDLPGKPDIVFRSAKKVIFVHGCFWHQHSCPRGSRIPKSRVEHWTVKLIRNKQRDVENRRRLNVLGFKVMTIWECELRDMEHVSEALKRFLIPCP